MKMIINNPKPLTINTTLVKMEEVAPIKEWDTIRTNILLNHKEESTHSAQPHKRCHAACCAVNDTYELYKIIYIWWYAFA